MDAKIPLTDTTGSNYPPKRGMLRPGGGGGSRLPLFIMLGLVVFSVLLFYNYRQLSSQLNMLRDDLSMAKSKFENCQKEKRGKELK